MKHSFLNGAEPFPDIVFASDGKADLGENNGYLATNMPPKMYITGERSHVFIEGEMGWGSIINAPNGIVSVRCLGRSSEVSQAILLIVSEDPRAYQSINATLHKPTHPPVILVGEQGRAKVFDYFVRALGHNENPLEPEKHITALARILPDVVTPRMPHFGIFNWNLEKDNSSPIPSGRSR